MFGRIQIGMPMTEEDLLNMAPDEQVFWHSFHGEAKETIAKMKESKLKPPFEPPSSLREKYRIAIEHYHGDVYCPVKQLEQIFNFGPFV